MAALPAPVFFVLMILFFVSFALGGQIALHRMLPHTRFVEHNDVAGFIISVAGTLYAVVLGFITVIVWQEYDGTRERLATETSAVGNAWHMAVGLPETQRRRVRSDMRQYVRVMATQEWPLMLHGESSASGDGLIMDATIAGGTFDARASSASNAQNLTLTQLGTLHEARSRRLASNAHGLSAFEWAILTVGAVVVISLCWLFGMDNPYVHLAMTGGVAVIVASMFTLVLAMQYPFRGQLAIDADPWLALERHMSAMDGGSSAPMRM